MLRAIIDSDLPFANRPSPRLGRDPDYLDLNVTFTIDVVTKGQIINMFPNFLKPCAPVPLLRSHEGSLTSLKYFLFQLFKIDESES